MALLKVLNDDNRIQLTATVAKHAVTILDSAWSLVEIPPFTYQDAVNLVDQMMPQNIFPPCVLEEAIETTGGNPAALQAQLHNVLEKVYCASALI